MATKGVAQIGGKSSFEFLSMPVNARTAALGGVNISLSDQDINMVYANPALLNSKMNRYVSISYIPFYAGIHATSIAYGHELKNGSMLAGGFGYHNYGTMQQTDPAGNVLGEFGASDYRADISYSQKIENYRLGATLRFAGSSIETYHAFGIALDVGALFQHPEKDLGIGLTIKNIGYAFNGFTDEIRPDFPINVQLGVSYKPEHMPVRLSLTAHHLQQFDIVYLDPAKRGTFDANGNEIREKKTFTDKVARHFIVGSEFVFSKNFNLRAGYNHLIRKELRLENRAGATGFSFGFMMRVKAFEFAYSRAYYHVAGGINYFTITGNLGSILKKKEE